MKQKNASLKTLSTSYRDMNKHTHTDTHSHTHSHTHTHTHSHTHTLTHTHTDTQKHTHTQTHTHTHTHTHTDKQTHTRTHAHTQTRIHASKHQIDQFSRHFLQVPVDIDARTVELLNEDTSTNQLFTFAVYMAYSFKSHSKSRPRR